MHDELAGLVRFGFGRDPQQQRFAAVEQGETLGANRRLGTVATDEALDRAVGQDQRLGTRFGAGRGLGEHHPGVHVRHA